jgi:hypothetical protein
MKQGTQTGNNRTTKTIPKIYKTSQFRRAKMHAAEMDSKKTLTPTLRSLLEASLILETTSPTILSAQLKRSPSTIRAEYQQIITLLGSKDK